jgi:hypothetical protein
MTLRSTTISAVAINALGFSASRIGTADQRRIAAVMSTWLARTERQTGRGAPVASFG